MIAERMHPVPTSRGMAARMRSSRLGSQHIAQCCNSRNISPSVAQLGPEMQLKCPHHGCC